jgi:hypothetical protein
MEKYFRKTFKLMEKKITKKEQERLLQEIIKNDEELGLYDMDYSIEEEKDNTEWYPDQKL